jgi:hypothetical protein
VKLSPHEIAYVARWAGFTDDELVTAVAVALAESGGDTDVMGRSTTGDNLGQRDHGLWQISGRWHGDKLVVHPNWRNPYENARMARVIYLAAGRQWTPWHVFTSGAYRTYLPDAEHGVRYPFKPATLGDRL